MHAALAAGVLGAFVLVWRNAEPGAVDRGLSAVGESLSVPAVTLPWAPGPAAAPRPVQAPAPLIRPAIPTPTQPADNGPYASRGVGLSRAAWESAQGPPSGAAGERLAYRSGRFVVGFRDGNVVSLELIWREGAPVHLEEARMAGRGWLPLDARFVRTYVPPDAPGQPLIDVYTSDSLRARFPDAPWRSSPWTRGEPGMVVVALRLTPDLRVTSTVVSAAELP